MRTPLYILCCFVVLSTLPLVAQQQLTVSLRVGAEIDSAEREYFGLLPKLDGAVTSTFFEQGANEVLWKVRNKGKEENYTISRKAFMQLGEYIERYEQLTIEMFDTKMADIIKYVQPIAMTERGKFLRLTLGDSTTLYGELLYATDSCLVMKTDTAAFAWEQFAKRTRVVHYSEIALYYPRSFWGTGTVYSIATGAAGLFFSRGLKPEHDISSTSATVDILSSTCIAGLGLVADIMRDIVIPMNYSRERFITHLYSLKDKEYFKFKPTLEVVRLLQEYRKSSSTYSYPTYSEEDTFRWHISIGSPLSIGTSLIKSVEPEVHKSPLSVSPSSGSFQSVASIGILYSILPHIRIGGGVSLWNNKATDNLAEWQNLMNFSVAHPYISCEYVLTSLSSTYSRFLEVSFALSPGIKIVTRDEHAVRINSDYEKIDSTHVVAAFSEVIPAIDAQITADMYVTYNFSISIRAIASLQTDNTNIPDAGFVLNRFGRLYGVAAKNISFNNIIPTVSLGARLHL